MTKALSARFERVTLRDFKSYREAALHLAPLTLLVGADASGKSNAIEAIRILAWLARGQHLETWMPLLRRSKPPMRESAAGCGIWSSRAPTASRSAAC